MKIAISNIAWRREEEEAVAGIMRELAIQGVEIAPSAVWPVPLVVTDADIAGYRRFWESRGIQIVALQALLFGRPDLTIFENAETRRLTFDYLEAMIRLGGKLGAKVLVFGSPKNRRAGSLPPAEIEGIAVPFFGELGRAAKKNDIVFCIEPNPAAYKCDFITTSGAGLELVKKVGVEGFGLHLDAGGMTLSTEPVDSTIHDAVVASSHFHASEVNLAPVGSGSVDHKRFATALSGANYNHWVSIEMRAQQERANLEQVKRALKFVSAVYGRYESLATCCPVSEIG